MKLCPTAQQIKQSFEQSVTYSEHYQGKSYESFRMARTAMDRLAMTRKLHTHMQRCKLCSP